MSLGHSLFFGVGAYTAAMVWIAGYSPVIGVFLGTVLAAGFALILVPSFRLRGIYFAISTLFLNAVVAEFFINWQFVGDGVGLYLPVTGQFSIEPFYYASLMLAVGTVFLARMLSSSKVGLALTAIREDDIAASVLGVKVLRYKILALVLSAAIFGTAGGVYAIYQTYINPETMFSIEWGIGAVFMAIMGGTGSISGPIVGAIIYTIIGQSVATFSTMRLLSFSILVLLIVRFMPSGIIGFLKSRFKRPFI